MRESITLLQLNRQVAQVVTSAFDEPLWIVAEIAQLNVAGNGHCYLELIEKSPRTNAITAKAKAMIWSNRWWAVSRAFELETGQRLQAGLKVMLEVQVQMHEAYGYSLVIQDIDATYTLGEMQRRRQEIIQRLTDEGMIDVNKSLQLPRLTQRIAVISADTAAGYGDFCHQLANNEYGLVLYTHLFPALMQGEKTEASVIKALERVFEHQEKFDAVVIIRGGGAVSDLNSFDSYELALNIANFPLPVITGIGHERDTTVLDAVAHTSVKTPTAAAAFLIERLANELSHLYDLQNAILSAASSRIEREKLRLARIAGWIGNTHVALGQQMNRLHLLSEKIRLLLQQRISTERQQLNFIEKSIEVSQPDNILKRGFSITRKNGKAVKAANELQAGDQIETQTSDGCFTSVVR
ncbi:MAG: exodeoxyribonuclease VII large subunit [Bacteroidales bacterium]|nr:exodeoxyribonuclease VII large subunit [Bacteroidales bacterium]